MFVTSNERHAPGPLKRGSSTAVNTKLAQQAKPPVPGRFFIYTDNFDGHPDDLEYFGLTPEGLRDIRWINGQREQGEGGRQHFQIYVEFRRVVRGCTLCLR